MDHPGIALIWTAGQVSVALVPAFGLHALASRRGARSGAWAASVGLGIVVALSLFALVPRIGPAARPAMRSETIAPAPALGIAPSKGPVMEGARDGGPTAGLSLADLRAAWGRFERRAAAPVASRPRLGLALVAPVLAGVGAGLIRLGLGLWAVRACRRRSSLVEDAALVGLLADLRAAMGCRRGVDLRELPGLAVPATAGWLRPMVLLPEGWRAWDGDERRAVLAHELAHVVEGDYAAGLVARLAVALHFYHPMVRHLAARLDLQQELAADALAARFAGGRARYLLALSRLALGRDGWPTNGPARAFLPAKGTLIRRIAMLREETTDRSWSTRARALATLGMIAAAGLVASFRPPALAGDEAPATMPADAKPAAAPGRLEPFDLTYFPDAARGLVAVRPSSFFRAEGMASYRLSLNLLIAQQWASLAKRAGVDLASVPRPLRVEMVDQVAAYLSVDHAGKAEEPRRVLLGDLFTIRMAEPFDWPALLRSWKQELTEVRDGDRTYYRMPNPAIGKDCCVYCPDDRTLVFAEETWMKKVLHRRAGATPDLAKGKGADRLLRGLAVVALDNRDGRLAKDLAKGEPEPIELAPLFERADRWIFGLEARDGLALAAEATCPDDASASDTARAAEALLAQARRAADEFLASKPERPQESRETIFLRRLLAPFIHPGDPGGKKVADLARRVVGDLVKGLGVRRDGRSVSLGASDFGKVSDLAALIAAEMTAW